MSKRLKITLIICALLAVVGMGLCTIGLFMSGFDVNVRNENLKVVEKSFDMDVSAINVNVNSDGVSFFHVDGDKITVKYYDEDNKYYTVEESGGELNITRNNVRKRWYEYINIAFVNAERRIEIGVPSGYAGGVAAKLSSGSLDISGLSFEKALELKLSSGYIELSDVYCAESVTASSSSGFVKVTGLEAKGEVSLKATSGSVKCENITCAALKAENTSGSVHCAEGSVEGDVYMKSTSGSVKAENISAGGEFSAHSTSGSVRVVTSNAESFVLGATSGSVKLTDSEYTESAELSSNSGSVTASFTDGIENYTIMSRSTSGSNNLPTSLTTGPKKLSVTTTSGSIHVSFAD